MTMRRKNRYLAYLLTLFILTCCGVFAYSIKTYSQITPTISERMAIEISKTNIVQESLGNPPVGEPVDIQVSQNKIPYDPVKKEYHEPIMKPSDEVEKRLITHPTWIVVLTYQYRHHLDDVFTVVVDGIKGQVVHQTVETKKSAQRKKRSKFCGCSCSIL